MQLSEETSPLLCKCCHCVLPEYNAREEDAVGNFPHLLVWVCERVVGRATEVSAEAWGSGVACCRTGVGIACLCRCSVLFGACLPIWTS